MPVGMIRPLYTARRARTRTLIVAGAVLGSLLFFWISQEDEEALTPGHSALEGSEKGKQNSPDGNRTDDADSLSASTPVAASVDPNVIGAPTGTYGSPSPVTAPSHGAADAGLAARDPVRPLPQTDSKPEARLTKREPGPARGVSSTKQNPPSSSSEVPHTIGQSRFENPPNFKADRDVAARPSAEAAIPSGTLEPGRDLRDSRAVSSSDAREILSELRPILSRK